MMELVWKPSGLQKTKRWRVWKRTGASVTAEADEGARITQQ